MASEDKHLSLDKVSEKEAKYTVKNPEAVKNMLLGKAVTDAREKASVLTRAGDVKLEDIQSIDYSWGEIDFEYSPMSSEIMADNFECEYKMRKIELDIEPDDIDVSDTVTVIWAII